MNDQPLRIVEVHSPQLLARLVEAMADGNEPRTATAPVVGDRAVGLGIGPTTGVDGARVHAELSPDGRRAAS